MVLPEDPPPKHLVPEGLDVAVNPIAIRHFGIGENVFAGVAAEEPDDWPWDAVPRLNDRRRVHIEDADLVPQLLEITEPQEVLTGSAVKEPLEDGR